MFVANPDLALPGGNRIFAWSDDVSDTGESRRTVLRQYNNTPDDNRFGLLPAWQLYRNSTYKMLVDHFSLHRLDTLSAGWGLIPADFLTPNYDVTLRTTRSE